MKSVEHSKGVLLVLKHINSYHLSLVIKIILLLRPVSKAVLYDEFIALNKSNRRWVNGFDWVLCTLKRAEIHS